MNVRGLSVCMDDYTMGFFNLYPLLICAKPYSRNKHTRLISFYNLGFRAKHRGNAFTFYVLPQ